MRSLIFIFLVSVFSNCFGQGTTNRKAQNLFDEADQLDRTGESAAALEKLEEAITADANFKVAHLFAADIYKRSKDFEKAKLHLDKAWQIMPQDPRTAYALGETNLKIGKYGEAKPVLTYFLSNYSGADTVSIKKAKKYLADCDFAIEALKHPVPYSPENLGNGINSKNREYFPALTADGQTIIYSRVENGNEDFFTSTLKNGAWQLAKPLSTAINTADFNEGAQSLSPDGRYLFFTGCNRPKGYGSCDIYITQRTGKDWAQPVNLGTAINGKYWDSQPAISPDVSTLYFASNRPGGFGGSDIWKSTIGDDGKWTKPVNLGPTVNTPFDETTPFMHADNQTLYFSSDGWPGMGGKDIFFTKLNADKAMDMPKNLGYPINSFSDENGLIVDANGTKGLFSTNLPTGLGDVDIYEFDMPALNRPGPVTYVKGIVIDAVDKKPVPASITLIDIGTNMATYNDYADEKTGDFLAVMPTNKTYAFNVEAPGYLMFSKSYKLTATNNKPFETTIELKKIAVGSNVVLDNVFFDIDKAELLPASQIELGYVIAMLNANPNLNIEIQGHTDSQGETTHNQLLSERRAKAVYDYLLAHKIDKQRLTFKGYGKSKPKADNKTEDGRQQNRRTEFVVTRI